MADKQYRNRDIEKALERRAREDLERKATETAQNEYNLEKYMHKKECAENRARRRIKRKSLKGPIIFAVVLVIALATLYLAQNGINIMDLWQSITCV